MLSPALQLGEAVLALIGFKVLVCLLWEEARPWWEDVREAGAHYGVARQRRHIKEREAGATFRTQQALDWAHQRMTAVVELSRPTFDFSTFDIKEDKG